MLTPDDQIKRSVSWSIGHFRNVTNPGQFIPITVLLIPTALRLVEPRDVHANGDFVMLRRREIDLARRWSLVFCECWYAKQRRDSEAQDHALQAIHNFCPFAGQVMNP